MPQASQGAKHAEQKIMRLPHFLHVISCPASEACFTERLHAPPYAPQIYRKACWTTLCCRACY